MSSNNPTQLNALRQQALSEALWDETDVAIVVTDVEGKFVDVSDGFCNLLGYARHELLGQSFNELLPTEDTEDEDTKDIAAAMPAKDTAVQKLPQPYHDQPTRNHQPTREHWTLLNKAGWCVNIASTTTKVNVAGESYQVITVKDVTALLQSRARQTELSQQLALALRLGDIQVWRWDIVRDNVTTDNVTTDDVTTDDVTTDIVTTDDSTTDNATTDNVERGSVRQADILEHIHEDDRATLLEATQNALAAPAYADSSGAFCEYRRRTLQGWQWVATTMSVTQRDAYGQPTVMLGVNRNIQDDKNRERDIGALRYKLEHIINAVQAGIIEINAYGEIIFINSEACEMLQVSASQLLTRHYRNAPWQFFDERGQALAAGGAPLFARGLETGQALHDIKVSIDQPRKWFNVRVQPLFDERTAQVSGVVVSLHDITTIESSRRELVNVSGRLVNILESTNDAFYSLDRQWRFTYINHQAEQTLQISRGQLLGQRVWDHFPEADEFRRLYQRVFDEQAPIKVERYYAIMDTYFEVHAYPFGDEIGVFFRDINERRSARKRLLESEERFRRSFESSPLGMVIVTPERQYIRANQNFCQMIGYREDEIIGRYTRDFTYPDDKEKTAALVGQLFAGEIASYTIDKRYHHKDNYDVWARLSVSLVRDEQGTPLYMIGQIQDLTEQLEREAAYQTIVDHALQGFVLLQAGRVVLANPAAVAILGYTEQEVRTWQRNQLWGVIYPPDVAVFTDAMRRLTTGKIDAFQGVVRFVHRHGDVRGAEVYLTSVPYQGATAVQIAFVDVTDRQNAQEEVKRALVERTVLLQEVHHRVRNNLQVIASMLNLQTKRLESIAAKHALEDSYHRIIAMAGVHRALHESEDLANIDFAAYLQRFMQSLLPPERSEVQLETLLEPTYLTAEQAIPCALIVNELVSNVLEHAFVDDAAREVISNLDEATQEETDEQIGQAGATARVYVRLQYADDIVTLSIADNGVGTLPDDHKRDTLGMTIVHSLVGQLDATLDIKQTSPGAVRPGTTVTVTFPIASSQL